MGISRYHRSHWFWRGDHEATAARRPRLFAPLTAKTSETTVHAIRDELAAGERLVWVGQPRPFSPDGQILPAGTGIVGILAGAGVATLDVLVLLVGLFDKATVTPGITALGGVLILGGLALFGLGLRTINGRRAGATSYALTDRRIILREPLPFGNVRVRSFRPRDLSGISRSQREDGSGDITLEGVGRLLNGMTGRFPLAQFASIERVREVDGLIRATLFDE